MADTDENCIFCAILAGRAEASIVYRDDAVTAFMDISPVVEGHVLVIPNYHTPDLAGVTIDAGGRIFDAGKKVAAAMRNSNLRCEGINFFLADGAVAGQTVFHTHLHVLPRHRDDGFGFQHGSFNRDRPSRETLKGLAEDIKKGLA
jgi:diadenosine tetraphosphate (Ap4A) HIT family hydrolase